MSDRYNFSETSTHRRLTAGGEDFRPMITVAPNGARRQKADHPALPITVPEIAKTAKDCRTAGADAIHLHVRNPDGTHTLDAGLYREAIAEIETLVPDMGIQITTEAAGIFDVSAQLACLTALAPSAASISVREIKRDNDLVRRVYATAQDHGTKVQHILYDLKDLADLRRMLEDGVVPQDMRDVLLVLGKYAPPQAAHSTELLPFFDALAGDFPNWTVCAFGKNEHAVMLEAARLGGDLRVGFENNICRPDGHPADDNAENIARIVTALQPTERPTS